MLRIFVAAGLLTGAAMAADSSGPITSNAATFNKDVLPILQKNCQECHRPGEVAPMSFLNYESTRPWAKAIKSAVATRKMPPWFADPKYGHFSNNHRLNDVDVKTLVTWADNGAPEGNAKDRPAPVRFQEGWNLKPDMVVEMPTEFHVPASGEIEYQYMLVKGDFFPEDTWVSAAEMRPGNPKAVHHGEVWVLPPGSKWMADAVPGVAYPLSKMRKQPVDDIDILGKFNPGVGAQDFVLESDSAKFVPKGSNLVFEIHYTAIGQATTDRTKVGIVFAKGPHTTRYFTSYGPQANNLVIPARDGNAEVVSEITMASDAKLVYAQPHMHLRGKDYELRLIYPTGESETVLKVKWDFNWQLGYYFEKPIMVPKGTRLVGISHFDNTANNAYNPDPNKEIRWGLQNWDEMSNAFLGFVFDASIEPKKLHRPSGYSLLPVGEPGPTLSAFASDTK